MVKRMLACVAVVAAALVVGACSAGGPKDPLTEFPTHYSLMLENDTVRVLKISYKPGDKTAMHHHPDAIVVGLVTGTTKFTMPDGSVQEVDLPADGGTYMPAGDHSPENVGTTPLEAILIEFKKAQPGTAVLPASREGMTITPLAEGAYATAMRVTSDPGFEEPAGTTHDYDQVVIALAPADVSLSIDGQAPKTSWTRGEVAFIGRGTPHATKHLSATSAEYVIVAIK